MFSTFSFITFFPSVNINSVNVQLRQWLYNHGEQCPWNTGGWLRCAYDAIPRNTSISIPKVASEVTFADASIFLSGSISANAAGSSSFYRGGGLVNANIGTTKPLPISIQKYITLQITGSNAGIKYNIRTGATNDGNTTTSTSIILQSGSGDSVALALSDYRPYIVIGRTLDYSAINGQATRPININESFFAEISEIWLK